jgi:hypothetical protein
MNNIRTVSAIAAVFIAATLVVGGTSATITTTTHSAFAWKKDGQDKYMKGGEQEGYKKDKQAKGNDGGSQNGNTVTIQTNKQKASQSGWDNTQEQEGQNTICTHPASSASCVSETEGGGGGGGGVCNSPLVEAHVGSETGFVICVDPSDLVEPNPGGECGSGVDVFIDSTHLCIPKKEA